jgi:hypothetical protein
MSANTKPDVDGTAPVAAYLPGWLGATVARHRCQQRRGRLAQRPSNDEVVKSHADSMVLTTDARGRSVWADVGWPACDERLVTVTDWPTLGKSRARIPTSKGPSA